MASLEGRRSCRFWYASLCSLQMAHSMAMLIDEHNLFAYTLLYLCYCGSQPGKEDEVGTSEYD